MDDKILRQRFHIFGKVQGVGFRYTALQAASVIGVSGFVRNEQDQSVTLEVQGTDRDIKRMLDAFKKNPHISIYVYVVDDLSVVEGERGFRVEY